MSKKQKEKKLTQTEKQVKPKDKKFKLTGRYSCYYDGKQVIPGETVLTVSPKDLDKFLEIFNGKVVEITKNGKPVKLFGEKHETGRSFDPKDPGMIPNHLDSTKTNDSNKDLNSEDSSNDSESDDSDKDLSNEDSNEENVDPDDFTTDIDKDPGIGK